MTQTLIDLLVEGDLRTTGSVPEVVKAILNNPSRVSELVPGLTDERPGVRMRSADALEKIAAKKPDLVQPSLPHLMRIAESATQQEVQWHLAQILFHLKLDPLDIRRAFGIMLRYYETSESNIVKTFSLTTLGFLAVKDESFIPVVHALVKDAIKSGSPAVKNRANKIHQILTMK